MSDDLSEDTPSGSRDNFEADFSDLDIPAFSAEKPAEETPVDAAPATATEATADEQSAEPAKTLEETVNKVAAEKPAAPAARALTFKAGEQEVSLAEDAVINWKVDGQVQPIKAKDLLENYAGKVAWDRKYQELATQRKQALADAQQLENVQNRHRDLILNMHKNASEGKLFDAVQSMLELTGLNKKIDGRTYIKSFREALMRQAGELGKLTPEQREAFEAREEKEYLQSQYTQLSQQREREASERANQDRVAKAMDSVNASLDEYVSTKDRLVKALSEKGEDVALVTPEYVAEQIQLVRDYRTAKEALDSIDPGLHKQGKLWDQAVKMLRENPEWNVDTIKEVFSEAVKGKRSQTLSKKVTSAPVATPAGPKTTGKPVKNKRADFSSFDAADVDW